ncbi:discoidin domain-containing protein [Candidatus Peregrinibacteria bacterium]|nr:discoidin domain-containing protein [Candidatus Peregrinibacteria bacterium]
MLKKSLSLLLLVFVLTSCAPKDPLVKPVEKSKEVDRTEEVEKVKEVRFPAPELVEVEDYQVSASSVLKDKSKIGFNYAPEMAFDRDFSTAWCAADGKTGAELVMNFADYVKVGKMGIVPGFARDAEIYNQNKRVKKLKVQFQDEEGKFQDFASYDLPDKYGMQFFDFEGEETKAVKFVIEDVYAGSKYEDLCIAEIDFWSDYVENRDAAAAEKYYLDNKAGNALKPNDIVSDIIVTDFVYALGYEARKSEYVPNRCETSFYPPTASKVPQSDPGRWYVNFGRVLHAFAKINQYGIAGDVLDVKWMHEEIDYEGEGTDDFNLNVIERQEWVLMASEKGIKVEEACNGELYAYATLDEQILSNNFGGMFGGGYKVVFLKNGKVVGEAEFYAGQ